MTKVVSTAATRDAYGKALLELGDRNPEVVVLGGDLNESTRTLPFAKKFPNRFFDFGPAEQNMISVASGMSSAGKIPFVSTFAVFGTGRAFDQLRVQVAQPKSNVKLVCTHAGIITGDDGMSAHGIEDLALASSLVGVTVIAPSDAIETVQAINAAAELDGPVYIRLYRSETPIVHKKNCDFQIGIAERMRVGKDVTIIAIGSMVSRALDAASILSRENIDCRVLNMHTLHPTDEQAICLAAIETGAIVTAEEHYINGGLHSTVSQVVSRTHPVPVEPVALRTYAESGDPESLLTKYNVSSSDIHAAVKRVLSKH